MAKAPISNPEHLRKRAADLRALAHHMHDDKAKSRMLELAEEYLTWAASAERQGQPDDNAKDRSG
jgi:hypothetical protein